MSIPDSGGVRWCLVRRIGEREIGGCGAGFGVGVSCCSVGCIGVNDSGEFGALLVVTSGDSLRALFSPVVSQNSSP